MKRLFFTMMILLVAFASPAFAAPFLICEMPTAGTKPTNYEITLPTGQSWMVANSPALATGARGFEADIANAPYGTTNITVRACAVDPLFGKVCSPPATSPLERMSPPLMPMLGAAGK